MHILPLLKKIFSEKKYWQVKSLVLRFFSFLCIFFLVDFTHETYTQKYFGYAVRTSDGFINYLPYLFLGAFFVLRLPSFFTGPQNNHTKILSSVYTYLALFFFLMPVPRSIFESNLSLIFVQSIFMLLGYISLFVAILGKNFIKKFSVDLSVIILLIIPSHLAPLLIDHFWQYSSRVTLAGLSLLFSLLHIDGVIIPSEFAVRMKDFSVIVGPSCAGIHSLTAFTVLYGAILLLASKDVAFKGYYAALFYAIGLFAVFLLNSIRVFLIILVGVYYSKDFAIHLFHETIGSVLLLSFFILYTSFILPKILRRAS